MYYIIVNKRAAGIFDSTLLDSQRLKDTFFSSPKKKHKKKPHHNKILTATLSATTFAVISASLFAFTRYDLLMIPHQNINSDIEMTSLLKKDVLSSLQFSGKNNFATQRGSSLYITVPQQGKVHILLNLKKPINLNKSYLVLYLKKVYFPLKIEVVARDVQFFSNSLNPLMREIKKSDVYPLEVALDFKETNVQNTNLSQINQLSLYLSQLNGEENSEESYLAENLVLIRDLVAVKKVAQ